MFIQSLVQNANAIKVRISSRVNMLTYILQPKLFETC